MDIPFGYCKCGCGQQTNICHMTSKRAGYVSGQPYPYLLNHHKRGRPVIEDAQSFKIDGVSCRLIPLTQGQYTIVDASDYEWLMQHKWHARWNKKQGLYYAQRNAYLIGGRRGMIHMHREILALSRDDPRQGDHILPTLTLDNRRKNLRIATASQNGHNRHRQTNNTSGFKNVFYHEGRYGASMRLNRKTIFIGYFDTKEEAHAAYCKKAGELIGEFTRTA